MSYSPSINVYYSSPVLLLPFVLFGSFLCPSLVPVSLGILLFNNLVLSLGGGGVERDIVGGGGAAEFNSHGD